MRVFQPLLCNQNVLLLSSSEAEWVLHIIKGRTVFFFVLPIMFFKSSFAFSAFNLHRSFVSVTLEVFQRALDEFV